MAIFSIGGERFLLTAVILLGFFIFFVWANMRWKSCHWFVCFSSERYNQNRLNCTIQMGAFRVASFEFVAHIPNLCELNEASLQNGSHWCFASKFHFLHLNRFSVDGIIWTLCHEYYFILHSSVSLNFLAYISFKFCLCRQFRTSYLFRLFSFCIFH